MVTGPVLFWAYSLINSANDISRDIAIAISVWRSLFRLPPSICHIQYSDTPLFSETSLIDNPNSNLLAFMLRPTISCNSCNSSILYHLKRWPGRRALHQPMAPSEDNKTPARTCLIFIGALSQRIFISIMRFLSPKVALVTPPECGYNKTLGERNGVRVGFY